MEFNDTQKKILEKVFARIFEGDKITEEGKFICQEAHVRPEDLKIKTYDDFKAELQIEEVAKIRHQHYSLKRLSKF
jgi:preprotein translocase subunit YajC